MESEGVGDKKLQQNRTMKATSQLPEVWKLLDVDVYLEPLCCLQDDSRQLQNTRSSEKSTHTRPSSLQHIQQREVETSCHVQRLHAVHTLWLMSLSVVGSECVNTCLEMQQRSRP